MKCLNMKTTDVLFSLANLIVMCSVNVRPNVVPPSRSSISGDEEILESKLEKDCPQIFKIIHDNNLTDYTIYCKSPQTDTINVENVLQQACFTVKIMLDFLCENNANMSTKLLFGDNVNTICPFDFSHLNHLGLKFGNYNLLKELTSKDHCPKVCEDLYSHRNQCLVLNHFNNCLKNAISPRIQEDINPLDVKNHPPVISHVKAKTINNLMSIAEEKYDGQSVKLEVKEVLSKERNVTEATLEKLSKSVKGAIKNLKEEKTEVTSTVRAENFLKDDVNISRSRIYLPEEDELKSDIEGPNEEFDDGISQANDLLSSRSDLDQREKILGSSFKGKEIYSGGGFFQAEDSHFFFYFIMVSSIVVISYLAFHNKNKILAYALEGSSARRSRRRPNPARYRKLETNLEEAISSCATSSAASSVVY